MNEFLMIEAAADGKRPKVAGLAYGGGKMKLPGWKHPVVVDLAGMEIPESVPLLTNHENLTGSRVGMVSAKVAGNALEIAGEIVAEGDSASSIVAQGKAGADWQLSIGAEVKESELVTGKRVVNGVEQEGPFYHVKKSALREVSVVAVGADASTRMKVAASFKLTGEIMDKDENKKNEGEKTKVEGQAENSEPKTIQAQATGIVPDAGELATKAMKAERERVIRIKAVCDGEFPKIEAQAVSEGWTPEETGEKVLKALRESRPMSGLNLVGKSEPAGTRETLEAAMCLRVGIPRDELAKNYGERAVEAAWHDRDMSLRALLCECMKIEGISMPRSFGNDTIHAAFSTLSLPGILSNVANKKLLQSFAAQPIIATKLCSEGDLSDFKENERFRLTDVGDLVPVAPDGEIKEGGLSEERAVNQLETYGKKFCLTRKMIINDDLGAFMKVPVAMGNRAARLIDQLFFSRLLANPAQPDGKALFHADHKNYLSGADSALTPEGMRKALRLFLDQVDSDGQPINVEPAFLLVATALKHTAIELTRGATLIMSGGDSPTVRPALNVLVDENLAVVSAPHLGNSSYSGSSEKGWYLFGNPAQTDTFEIGYLKGNRTPTVERGDVDFNTLGIWFRVYFDLGVREQDFRGMVKANGE